MTSIAIALVGLGKIARDQHLPAIAADDRFRLAAVVDPSGQSVGEAPGFRSLEDLLAADVEFDAAVIATPPQPRHGLAHAALSQGRHVMLEKPPGATVAQVEDLRRTAQERGLSLYTAWHSRHAAGVAAAGAWLASRSIRRVAITWKEDVRAWHPGQDWIFEAGGLGVFDPGINALSIVTRILPRPLFVVASTLETPVNRQAPVKADLTLEDAAGVVVQASFDCLQSGEQTWEIEVETDGPPLLLSHGGAQLWIGEQSVIKGADNEYASVYDTFASLIAEGQSDVDAAPLAHVADAFLIGRRSAAPAFHW